ncbi:DNA-formamidopyrimidine glycosylase family protein [Humibacter sp. RRB41]|uniref:DNA-formamidopyrimidine glycosylase family protein n=1 Tax=Humibacter sp. RRB41 TaxID=2919946 RepID=UPI001FAAF015|nr:DNA-formamidopyrimidine glycosylase family protein [Humibacter sp. RRB41]
MPESPEVQALVEFVAERAVGRDIAGFEVLDYPEYKTRAVMPSVLAGCRIVAVSRHGKYVDIDAGEHHLVISFGRGGWLVWHDDGETDAHGGDAEEAAGAIVDAPAVASVALSGGSGFDVIDTGGYRSVGLWIVDRPTEVPGVAKLGPDPVDPAFSRESFDRPIVGRRKQLKAVLQEQTSFAGIGNAYSDEILFVARLSPVIHASELSEEDRDRLFDALRTVPRSAIDARRGIPLDRLKQAKIDAMLVHGRAGEPCPNGDGTVHDFTFAGASAQYCPECQTGGVIL